MRKLLIVLVSTLLLLVSCSQPQNSPKNLSTNKESPIALSSDTLVSYNKVVEEVVDVQETVDNKVEKVKVPRIKRNKVDYAFVSGIVLSKADRRVKIVRKTPKEGNEDKVRLKLDKEKNFEGKIELEDEGYYVLDYKHRKYDIFLTPGDSLFVEIDIENKDLPLVFSGTGSGINNYIRQRIKTNYDLSMKKRHLFKMDYSDFSDTLTSKRTALLEILDDANKVSADFTKSFYNKEKGLLFFNWADDHFDYKKLALKYGSKTYNERIQDYNTQFIEELDLDDPNLLDIPSYQNLITQYFNDKVDGQVLGSVPGRETDGYVITGRHKMKYDLVKKHFKNKDIQEYIKTEVVASLIREDGTPTMNEVILKFRKDVENEEYLNRISKYIEKYAYIDDGSLAPEFVVQDTAGGDIKLSDFKGKYVYIDVWASWCGPCKHEIPYFAKLKEEYKEKNIEFVSISIDKTKEPWERMLNDWQLSGHQYIAKGAWESDIAKSYHLKGVPQFILIDPEGQIIDLSAARPSGRIRNDFERLNI